jgi:hypothetical protein
MWDSRDLLRHATSVYDCDHTEPVCIAVALALASQVRDLNARLELRSIHSATGRVLGRLHLKARGIPPRVASRRSWTLIAEEVGLSRERLCIAHWRHSNATARCCGTTT